MTVRMIYMPASAEVIGKYCGDFGPHVGPAFAVLQERQTIPEDRFYVPENSRTPEVTGVQMEMSIAAAMLMCTRLKTGDAITESFINAMLNAAGFIYENSQGREQLVSMMERMLDKLTNFPHIPVDNIVAAMNPNIRTGRMSSSKPNTMLLPKADLGTAVGDDENEEPYTEISCTRRLQFCAGHRVLGHENKCAHPHGHNYVVLLEAAQEEDSTKVDGIGRVIDFSVLKEKVGGWIDAYWDHGFLYNKTDTIMRDMLESYGNADHSVKGDFKTFAMPYNPTAENMAKFLLHHVGPNVLAGTGVRLVRVKVWETENCVGTACVA